jgi:DnaK suppressor protein
VAKRRSRTHILAMTKSQRDDAAIVARLRARRAEVAEAAAAHQDERRPVQLDQTGSGRLSRMDALQGQAMAIELERRREIELARIDSALERLAEGEYGYCVTCSQAIEQQRLEFDPAIPLCLGCARRVG